MDASKKYCIDTSTLIDFHRGRYPRDIFETIWDKIEIIIEDERLVAPRQVYVELEQKVEETGKNKKVDELWKWAKSHKKIFLDASPNEQMFVGEIITKFNIPRLKTTGRENADPWVIAIAKYRNLHVVTSEGIGLKKEKATKIPDICKDYSVECFFPVDLFRAENWKFR